MHMSLFLTGILFSGVPTAASSPLDVVVSASSGCVQMDERGQPFGPDVDRWRTIAGELGLTEDVDYRFRFVPFGEILDNVEDNPNAIGLSCVSATSSRLRDYRIEYSFPYYEAGIGVMMRAQDTSAFETLINAFRDEDFRFATILLFVSIFIAGLIAFVLTKLIAADDDIKGPFGGVYFALVTSSTVGYGDITPKSRVMRIFAMIMIMCFIPMYGYQQGAMTAAITTANLSAQVNSLSDLRGKQIATVKDTTSADSTRTLGGKVQLKESLQEAVTAIEAGEVDAVVFDAPALQQHIHTTGATSLQVLNGRLSQESYVIVLSRNSLRKREIDRTILKLRETGQMARIDQRWYGQ